MLAGESGSQPTSAQRRFPRSFVIIVFGPVVGAAVMTAILLGMATPWQRTEGLSALGLGVLLFMSFGYMAGVLPAVASAVLWRFVPAGWRLLSRALAAVLIGATCGAALIWPFFMVFIALLPPNLSFAALSALCGAIALLATALPFAERD